MAIDLKAIQEESQLCGVLPAKKKRTIEPGCKALVITAQTNGLPNSWMDHADPSQPYLTQLSFVLVSTKQDANDWKEYKYGPYSFQDSNPKYLSTALDLFESFCVMADVLVGHNIQSQTKAMRTAFHRSRRPSTNFESLASNPDRRICTMTEMTDICKLPCSPTSYKLPSREEACEFITGKTHIERLPYVLVDSNMCIDIFRYLVEQQMHHDTTITNTECKLLQNIVPTTPKRSLFENIHGTPATVLSTPDRSLIDDSSSYVKSPPDDRSLGSWEDHDETIENLPTGLH